MLFLTDLNCNAIKSINMNISSIPTFTGWLPRIPTDPNFVSPLPYDNQKNKVID